MPWYEILGETAKKGRVCADGWHPFRGPSDFDHFKIILPGAAVRTGPVDGYVYPPCSGSESFLGQAFFLVVNEAAE